MKFSACKNSVIPLLYKVDYRQILKVLLTYTLIWLYFNMNIFLQHLNTVVPLMKEKTMMKTNPKYTVTFVIKFTAIWTSKFISLFVFTLKILQKFAPFVLHISFRFFLFSVVYVNSSHVNFFYLFVPYCRLSISAAPALFYHLPL